MAGHGSLLPLFVTRTNDLLQIWFADSGHSLAVSISGFLAADGAWRRMALSSPCQQWVRCIKRARKPLCIGLTFLFDKLAISQLSVHHACYLGNPRRARQRFCAARRGVSDTRPRLSGLFPHWFLRRLVVNPRGTWKEAFQHLDSDFFLF
jgi:hypothetical protein